MLRHFWVRHVTNLVKTPTIDICYACLNSLVWRLKSRASGRRMGYHFGPAESAKIQQHRTGNTGSDKERESERERERERRAIQGKRERVREKESEKGRESERARER